MPRKPKPKQAVGNADGYSTLDEALQALKGYLDPDGVIEVHADGCDGRDECGCEITLIRANEIAPGAKA